MSQHTAVILVNLGTPDAPTKSAVRRYLKEFLWDDRIIKRNPLWWVILNGIILNTRPKRVAKLYESIWQGDSPIRTIGGQQRDALQSLVKDKADVFLAMTYGQPSLRTCLDDLALKNYQKVIVLPLFPQYSATTTGAVFDQVADFIKKTRNLPEIHLIKDYHQSETYIEALTASIQQHWQENGKAEKLLLSFHGIPQIYVDQGDPYEAQIKKTVELLAHSLGLEKSEFQLTFQSRFGPTQWLQPYTDKTLEKWANSSVKSVDIICPAFSADCLETLEEIAVENRDIFLTNGGKQYNYIPALNNTHLHIEMMHKLVTPFLKN